MCNVFASLLWCLAWEAKVMLVSVLGCSACGEELCLPLLLWCLAWEADVTLASVLGCLECGEELCLTLGATVPGLGGGGDACFGARLLGM